MASQRISEALADIGSEDAKRSFFREYIKFLEAFSPSPASEGIDDGILIDSSGLPNAVHFPLAEVNNHNGVISQEVRLIYVVQQRTGLPLFFRYVAGNVIDVSTITRTIAELKANGVNTKFAILDAGYYTEVNAENENTFRGPLMMTFIAAAALKLMSDKLSKTSLTTESMFMILHEQHALVYDEEFITTEPVKKMNEAYKALKLHCPEKITRQAT